MKNMDKIFKLVDYLLNNEPIPEMRLCPIYFTLQLKYQDSFKQHINIRFQNDKVFYIIDGNYNPIFINFFLTSHKSYPNFFKGVPCQH